MKSEKNSKSVATQTSPFDLNAVVDSINTSCQELIEKIGSVAAAVDAEYAFQGLVTCNLLEMNGTWREVEHGSIPSLTELAAFHLYPHFGKAGARDAGQLQVLFDALKELNQLRSLSTAFGVDRSDQRLASLQVHLLLHAEGVRGSAYPWQLRTRIEQVQGPFDTWFQTRIGIGPLRALAILSAFEEVLNDNYQSSREQFEHLRAKTIDLAKRLTTPGPAGISAPETNDDRRALAGEMKQFMDQLPLTFPASFDQVASKVENLTITEWDALRELIGLTPKARRTMQHAREIKDRPIYYLSDERFVLVDMSSVYDALFDAYDRLTRSDFDNATPNRRQTSGYCWRS